MQPKHFLKAAVLTIFLILTLVISWELYLRNNGITISYDDGPEFWSSKRARVYQPSDKATVFIGSSRIKYDLDIDTWKALTGEEAVQLAIEGESPVPVLDDLAADKNFRGKLVIDVTEGLFFSTSPSNTTTPKKFIEHFKKETPSQKFSFQLNTIVDSRLAFLDHHYLSLSALWDHFSIPPRKGVFSLPHDFPMDFGRNTPGRQSYMTPRFLKDTNLQRQVTSLWEFFSKMMSSMPREATNLDSLLGSIKSDVDNIRARGGEIIFVRTPSSGPFWMGEQKVFPRDRYWDRLLNFTHDQGIHFADYSSIDHFVCPEWSHLSPQEATVFTKNFIEILEKDKGWKFPHKNSL